MKQYSDLEYFCKISNNSSENVKMALDAFKHLCSQLNRINTHNCNEQPSNLRDKKEKRLLIQALALANFLGCKLHHTGDPRGASIRLIRPDQKSNGWDGLTWYVE